MEEYICAQGESFDWVSLKVYGDEKWAGLLLEANGQYGHMARFEGGEKLVIPDAWEPPPTLPPWRKTETSQA